MGRHRPVVMLRAALWLVLMRSEMGQCVWDTMSERYDGIGNDDAHNNGKDIYLVKGKVKLVRELSNIFR